MKLLFILLLLPFQVGSEDTTQVCDTTWGIYGYQANVNESGLYFTADGGVKIKDEDEWYWTPKYRIDSVICRDTVVRGE